MVARPEVLAIIPARGGSKGIPRKNIRNFAGYPLIAYSSAAGLQAETVRRVIISTDDAEIAKCLATIKRTHAGTGFMHESFNPDDPAKFSRKWFAWANTLFGELIVKLDVGNPKLLSRTF